MITCVLACVFLVATSVAMPTVDPVAEAIRRQLEAAGQPAVLEIEDEIVHASTALPAFYERHGFAPAWSRRGRFEPRARPRPTCC